MSKDTGTVRRRVAIIFGDERIKRYDWPQDLDLRLYEADSAAAKKLVAACDAGRVDDIVVHHRFTPTSIIQMLRRQKSARVLFWPGSPVELTTGIYKLLGIEPPAAEGVALTSNRAEDSRKSNEWSGDEEAALLLAHEKAGGDRAKFVDLYLDLVRDLSVPMRSSVEVHARLDAVLEQRRREQAQVAEQLAVAREQLARVTEELAQASKEIENARAERNEAVGAAERMKAENVAFRAALDNLERQLAEMRRERDAKAEEACRHMEKLESAAGEKDRSAEIDRLTAAIRALVDKQPQFGALSGYLGGLKKSFTTLSQYCERLGEEVETYRTALKSAEEEIARTDSGDVQMVSIGARKKAV